MHPYEMGVILRQRHKEESIKLRYGSLYTVIEMLLKRGLISSRETSAISSEISSAFEGK